MYCPGCATRLDQIAAFCPQCGRDLQSLMDRMDVGSVGSEGGLAVPWQGRQVIMGLVLVGIAFLVISGGTVILERLGAGLAWARGWAVMPLGWSSWARSGCWARTTVDCPWLL